MNKVTLTLGCVGLLVGSVGGAAQEKGPSAKLNHQQTVLMEQQHPQQAAGTTTTNPLLDHGGPVLNASNLYAIYWGPVGDFPFDLQRGMTELLSGFGGSSYLGIAQQYMRTNTAISSSYKGSLSDTSAPPTSPPNTAAIGAEVVKMYPSPDPNGIYFVFTSNAPKINYCAWHDKVTVNGVTFQVAYVPNQAKLLTSCSPYIKSNLGCNQYSEGTVATADSVAHEFMEAVTDPRISAWYDKKGYEIADKCNFVYKSCVQLASGGPWQLQAEWSNAINGCQQ